MKSRMLHRAGAWCMLSLVVAQLLLVFVSWLITAAMPDYFTHTLLSAEGIRWFFGRFVENLSSFMLVWLLLISIALGALLRSGLLSFDRQSYRQRVAMRFVAFEFLLFLVVILALTLVPHAILLNVMGSIWMSSFTKSVVPYTCLAVLVMSLSFGVMSHRLRNLEDVYHAAYYGVKMMAPLFLLYVLAVQLYSSVIYLFF